MALSLFDGVPLEIKWACTSAEDGRCLLALKGVVGALFAMVWYVCCVLCVVCCCVLCVVWCVVCGVLRCVVVFVVWLCGCVVVWLCVVLVVCGSLLLRVFEFQSP